MALKLFMNVMYGYTGASFSGRMPCSDIADSVVETGKTIVKDSIAFIVFFSRVCLSISSCRRETNFEMPK